MIATERKSITPDRLSRLDSPYTWQIHPKLYHYIDQIHGPHNMDRFACAKTAMCENYNSLFYDPHTHGVDALFQSDWGEFLTLFTACSI